MTKVLSLRVPDDLAAWADEYAGLRGVTRQDLLVSALESFREGCLSGVPELRARIRLVQEPVRSGLKPAREDFAVACRERAELFGGLRSPASARGGKP